MEFYGRCQRGFTLLEALLALTILSVIIVIVLSALRLGIRSWEKGEVVVEDSNSIRFLHSKFAKDIGSIYPYFEKNAEIKRHIFIGNSDTLGFITAASDGRFGMPHGGLIWVYYSVRDTGLTVMEKTFPSKDMVDDTGGRLIDLDQYVENISFEYMGNESWEKSWNAILKKGLPVAIRTTVFFRDKKRPLTITVPIGVYFAQANIS